jgi:hypothetical protein
VRYVEDRSTLDVLSGSRDGTTDCSQRWELGLSDDPDHPWRVLAIEASLAA